MKIMFSNLFVLLLTVQSSVFGQILHANDSEALAYQALQASGKPFPTLQRLLIEQVKSSVHVQAVHGLFAQQVGVEPIEGEYQLGDFGALISWDDILKTLYSSPQYRLLILIRHGQAWENLNPTSNKNCEFEYNGETIQNFDSPLSPDGKIQAQNLNSLFSAPASNTSTRTWYETIGLSSGKAMYITSPLSRTMQTTEEVFRNLHLSSEKTEFSSKDIKKPGSFHVHELIRASAGSDVCNFRHNVQTSSTVENALPKPWNTGCAEQINNLPSLQEIYQNSSVNFSFSIRPAGGYGFGLISDGDQLWRGDVSESDEVINARATAFLAQVREYTPVSSVVAVVTHGEMVSAIYQAAGEMPYGPKNTQVVPLLIKYTL